MEIEFQFYLLFVAVKMEGLCIYDGDLDVQKITSSWYEKYKTSNYGALINFIGVVREENGIQGLSFDIYEPILNLWFKAWQEKAKKQKAIVLMAHSLGNVPNHKSSYIAGICSPQRRVGLELIDEFVEDFKKNAPIWKYDLINNKRIYAKERSTALSGAGILS